MEKNQSFSYVAIFLSLLHIVLLKKTWLIYAIVVGLGFIIRILAVKNKIISLSNNRKKAKI
jgi:sulfoxide reductase heme-binding subunit YedZ